MPEKIQACQDLNLDLCDPGTTNYAVAKASLHLHQIKSLRSCHFLITFFCYYFILLTFFLFISFSFRPCWKNKWVSPSCSKRFGQKRTKNVHSWWNVLSCKGSVLSCGKKRTSSSHKASRLRFSYKNALITCNTLLDDQDVIELPACYNNVIFSNTCTGTEKNYSQKILIPLI